MNETSVIVVSIASMVISIATTIYNRRKRAQRERAAAELLTRLRGE